MREVKIKKGKKKTFARVCYDSWHVEHIDIDGLNAKEAADKIKKAQARHDAIRDRRQLLHEIDGATVGVWDVIGETLIPHGIDVELQVVLSRAGVEREVHRQFYPSPEAVPSNAEILTEIARLLDVKVAKHSDTKDFENEVKQKLGLG